MKNKIIQEIKNSIEAKQAILEQGEIAELISQAADMMIHSLKNNGKILIAGNGGSAADAQHIAGELVNRFNFDRPPLPAIALTTDSSVITAISNDSSYDDIFAKQIQALGNKNDVLIAISTSGNAENIVQALKACPSIGVKTIGLTGNTGGKMRSLCDCCLCVPSEHTPRIQESHIMIAHILCGLTEEAMFSPPTGGQT